MKSGPKPGPRKTHCKRGHLRTAASIDNSGYCRACAILNTVEWKKRNPLTEEGRLKQNSAARKWRKNNPGACKEADFRNKLKANYGLTSEQYRAMLEAQGNCCAICSAAFGNDPYKDGPCVDHIHDAGKRVREILCAHCNRMIGCAHDNINVLLSAIEYLRKHADKKAATAAL